MLYRLLADLVLIVHLLFVVCVVLGGFCVLRWPHLMWPHLAAALYGVAIELIGFACPLTLLEVSLRNRGGEAGYDGGCIDHYITAALYPAGLTRNLQFLLGALVLLLNTVIYTRVIRQRRAAH